MQVRALGRRLFHLEAAFVVTFWSGFCFAQIFPSQAERVPQPASSLQREGATVELRTTLAGNMKDFSVATGGLGKQDELENVLRLDQHLAKARNQLGALYLSNGDKTMAENEFRTAIVDDPKYVEAKNNLGVVLAWTGRSAEAAELFREALSERPNYGEAYVNLGLVLAAQEKYAEAEKEVRLALRLTASNLSALRALGMLEVKLGHGEQAIEILRKVARQQPEFADAHSNLGMALAADGFDLPGALEQLSEAIRLEPRSAALLYSKGRILHDLNRAEEARRDLAAACQLQPDYHEALYLLAQVEQQLGNIQRSADILDQLVTREPSNADAQLLLGRNLVLLGKTEEAIHHLQIAVGVSPNNPDALYALGQALNRAGKPEAKLYLDRFEALKQQREVDDRVHTLGSYGLEAANARDWPQAVAHFKEAIDLCGDCPSRADLHRNLGLIYILKGEIENGRNELETALRIKPNDTDARKALETLPVKKAAPY